MPYKLTLRLRATIIFIAVYALVVVVLAGILHYLFIDTFKKLETDRMNTNIDRITQAIEKEKEVVNTLNFDWSVWDDTYDFMNQRVTKTNTYLVSNVSSETLNNLRVNLLTYFTINKKVHFTTSLYQEKVLPNQDELNDFIAARVIDKLYKENRTSHAAFASYKDHLFLISVSPILKSNKKGISRGYLVMAKIVDENFIARLSDQLLIPLKIDAKQLFERRFSDDKIVGHVHFPGLFKQNILTLHTSLKTTFLSRGRAFLKTTLIASMVILVIMFKLMHILVMRGIVNRIAVLENDLEKISLDDDHAGHLKFDGIEDEVSQLRHSINSLLERIYNKENELLQASKLATVGTMVSTFAHEINNPVFALKGSFQLMKLKLDRANSKEMMDLIGEQINSAEIGLERISHIVGSLTSFVRANHGDKERIDVHENINKCTILLEPVIKSNEITLIKSYSAEIPLIFANAGQFQQVMTNLITNAKDALQGVINPQIKIVTTNVDKNIVIEVIDNGHGIEDTTKIFQTFYTTKPRGKGTGLGLGIVEQIISNLDGYIHVDSTVGEGTTFKITIPNSKTVVQS